ncbi:MAG: TatD family hydrolase, partial [Sulfuricurvum sp.]
DEEKLREKQRQEEVFRTQIRFAKKVQKPLIVHIRDASHDAKMILLEEGAGEVGGVLHCYNADDELLSLSEQNFYFGIGGVVTFSNAKKLINILPRIPKDKLILETDGPYLTPHPHRGARNESAYTRLVAQKVSDLLESEIEDIESLTTQNSTRLFGNLIV